MAVESGGGGGGRSVDQAERDLRAKLAEVLGPLYNPNMDPDALLVRAREMLHIKWGNDRTANSKAGVLADLARRSGTFGAKHVGDIFGDPGTVGVVPAKSYRQTYDRIAGMLRSEAAAAAERLHELDPSSSAYADGYAALMSVFGNGATVASRNFAELTGGMVVNAPVQVEAPTAGQPAPADDGGLPGQQTNAQGEVILPPQGSTPAGPSVPVDTGGGTTPNTGGGTTPANTGGGTNGAGSPTTNPDDTDYKNVPGGGQIWEIDDQHLYLVYIIPGTNTPLFWHIEDPERLNAITGGNYTVDRKMSAADFQALAPWQVGGVSAELALTDDDPWSLFVSEWNKQVALRPWLNDPSVVATVAVAYLEGRQPTADELAQTDWWNEHTEAERAWMELTATAGQAEVQERLEVATAAMMQALRDAGMNNPPEALAGYLAMQQVTGKWSAQKVSEQVRKLVDPYAPGTLDPGILAVLRDPDATSSQDAAAMSEGYEAVRDRVEAIFEQARIPADKRNSDELARNLVAGTMSWSDLYQTVDQIALSTPGAIPGGLDTTRAGEAQVEQLAARWLGPTMGNMTPEQISEWAGRIRNDPDALTEFTEFLQQQRMSLLPGYTNPNLTYEDIIQPVRNLAANIWGQPVQDEALLLDLANTMDYSEMSTRLRQTGLEQGVAKVTDDALSGLLSTSLGSQVVSSTI